MKIRHSALIKPSNPNRISNQAIIQTLSLAGPFKYSKYNFDNEGLLLISREAQTLEDGAIYIGQWYG